MQLLRTTERPEQKYSLAFVGYGDESEGAVLELTYNHGVERYDLGTAYGHVAIEVPDAAAACAAVRAKGGSVTREAGPGQGRLDRDRVRAGPRRLQDRADRAQARLIRLDVHPVGTAPRLRRVHASRAGPHFVVCPLEQALEVARETGGVEQRQIEALAVEVRPVVGERSRSATRATSVSRVLLGRSPRRARASPPSSTQARADPPSECAPGVRRAAVRRTTARRCRSCATRTAARRARGLRKRRRARCCDLPAQVAKHDALGRDAPRRCGSAEIVPERVARRVQPKHRGGRSGRCGHPEGDETPSRACWAVEAREHDARLGQAPPPGATPAVATVAPRRSPDSSAAASARARRSRRRRPRGHDDRRRQ